MGKKWYSSRTVWGNIVSLVSVFLAAQVGFEVSAEETAAVLVFINLVFRAITREPLSM